MGQIDYALLEEEILAVLKREKSIVLATAFENRVTARSMSHVNEGLAIYFQTGGDSEKAFQIKHNAQIAFAVANLQVEAVAEICGHSREMPLFLEQYKEKFPQYFAMYTGRSDEIVMKAVPRLITLYKYIDGEPCKDILDVKTKSAVRIF